MGNDNDAALNEAGEPEANPQGSDGAQEGAVSADGRDDGGEVLDGRGQPGINAEKYRREMKAKDDEIAALKAQVAEAAKTEEGRRALEEKIAKLEADQRDERATYDLRLAGIRDDKAVKAAKAMLPDYDGDVAKLKEDCPYLFSDGKKTGSTGLKPDGGAGKGIDAKLDRIFGVED